MKQAISGIKPGITGEAEKEGFSTSNSETGGWQCGPYPRIYPPDPFIPDQKCKTQHLRKCVQQWNGWCSECSTP